MRTGLASYYQSALQITPEQIQAVAWKSRVMGVNAQTLADQHGKNVAAAATIWGIMDRGVHRLADQQMKLFQAASAQTLSTFSAPPSMSPQESAKLTSEATRTMLSEWHGVYEIAAMTGDEVLEAARQRTIEGAQQMRRHIRREDLY